MRTSASVRRSAALRAAGWAIPLSLALALTPAANGQVQWRAGASETPLARSAESLEADLLALGKPGAGRVLLHFARPVEGPERAALLNAGVELLAYVGTNAYFGALHDDKLEPAAAVSGAPLIGAEPVQLQWKMHPDLNAGLVRSWSIVEAIDPKIIAVPTEGLTIAQFRDAGVDPMVAVYVILHPDARLDAFTAPGAGLDRAGGKAQGFLQTINGLVVHLPASRLASLAIEDDVQWVEPPIPLMGVVNDSNRTRVGADTVASSPYNLDGSGVQVLVYDGSQMFNHVGLAGRLTLGSGDFSGAGDHATHVAGTIGGSGAGSANNIHRGMAPGVTFISYGIEQEGGLHQGFLYNDPCDIQNDYNAALNTHGADIANNSIGTNTASNGFPCVWTGDYGVTDVLIDSIVRGSLGSPFRVVWANGNERQTSRCVNEDSVPGEYHSTAPPACAKNHITVGAMNSNDDSVTSFTSWGPADDGRLKPDVSAPGCQSNSDFGVTSATGTNGYSSFCGTSMASPTTCGIAALLLEDFRTLYPDLPDPRNSTLKILLAHSAVDIESPGPDYKTGYGSIRAPAAVDLLRSGNFLEQQIDQSQSYNAVVVVNPGDPQMRITLAWDDAPATPNIATALINDLDLVVHSPSGQRVFPWTLGGMANPAALAVQTMEDHINNIEQVLVNNPEPGGWLIEIRGTNIPQGPQPFSLTASPFLVNCSDAGVAALGGTRFSCASQAALRVVDCGLNTSDEIVDTVAVVASSTSDPVGEIVILTETAAEAATFIGSIQLSAIDAPGTVRVAHGDTLTLTYIDADNGQGGTNLSIIATAPIDCEAPSISNVLFSAIGPRDAIVSFTTNEPARATVRFGESCQNPSEVSDTSNLGTTHTIELTGLTDNLQYFVAIEAADAAGNAVIDNNGGSCYTFTTPEIPNFFTEQFTGGTDANDLDNRSITYTPDGTFDFYDACRETISSLPTDPAGGTPVAAGDDTFHRIFLPQGVTVSLYGTSFTSFYIGSNGYITFTSPTRDETETLIEHFGLKRVDALYDDLNPAAGGAVSWKLLGDRVAVTWLNVPEYTTTNSNTLQIELYFDGRLRTSWLGIDAQDGLTGLSEGEGIPAEYLETNVSGIRVCPVPECPADFNNDLLVTSADITAFLSAWFGDLSNGTTLADFNHSGVTTSADITAFLGAWFDGLAAGC
ncbi:MAG: S8 family serine peptidase [Phycisphaerales bacterium]|nr:S8 family serine peptidase [Phycisphaerales bacterium]